MSFDSGIGLDEEQRIMLAKYEIKNEHINDIGIGKEQWIDLLKDEEIIKIKDVELLKCVYNNSSFMATSPQLALLLNKNHYVLKNEQIGKLGRRIASKLKIKAPKEPDCE